MKIPALVATLLLLTSPLLAALESKPTEPLHIARGQRVKLEDYLLPGKIVVFDFTSKFCPPCRAYEQPLQELHARRADIVVIKVDINRPNVRGIDWQSPVARQYGLHAVPSFKIYSAEGKLMAEDRLEIGPEGNVTKRDKAAQTLVDTWISQPST